MALHNPVPSTKVTSGESEGDVLHSRLWLWCCLAQPGALRLSWSSYPASHLLISASTHPWVLDPNIPLAFISPPPSANLPSANADCSDSRHPQTPLPPGTTVCGTASQLALLKSYLTQHRKGEHQAIVAGQEYYHLHLIK